MTFVALLRHGQSQWNLENRFTGWVDVDLTPEGERQASRAGALIGASGVAFDKVFTSVLGRAIRTGDLALHAAGLLWLPVEKSWRLNERHYGALTGLNKAETAARHGEEQVKIWRRSYDVPPPLLEAGGEYDLAKDRRYASIADLPRTESLKMTLERVLPYWNEAIALDLRAGKNLIIAAHGNSLRAIVKHLFKVADDQIVHVEMPTGNPLLIELSTDRQWTSAEIADLAKVGLSPSNFPRHEIKPISARYLDEARAEKLPPMPA
jgi:2,3-bisphosphoglycerate-dependent phosphoglycerate mutase